MPLMTKQSNSTKAKQSLDDFLQIPRLFTCSISSCDSDVLINIFDKFFDNCDELTLESLTAVLLHY